MPYDVEAPFVTDCIFCGDQQYPDAIDLLSEPTLEFVREKRDGQIEMCAQITDAIVDEHACVYEAGTGVGKSFAYLLPAIMLGKRVVISTAKKTLQAQLLEKDLPFIKEHLSTLGHIRSGFTFAGAYGRNNFACYLTAHKTYKDTRKWGRWEEFFKRSDYGHWADIPKYRLKQVDMSQNAEGCIGVECAHYKGCGFIQARKDMLAADVVVCNNWILGFHYKILREDPERKLLGDFAYVIVDEAHKIEDGIRSAFTNKTSMKHVDKLHSYMDSLNDVSANVISNDPVSQLALSMQSTFEDLSAVKNTDTSKPLRGPARTTVQQSLTQLQHIKHNLLAADVLPTLFHAPRPDIIKRFSARLTSATPTDMGADVTPGMGTTLPFPHNEQDQRVFLTLDKLITTVDECVATFESILAPRANRVWEIKTEYERGKVYHVLEDKPIEIGNFLPDKNITYVSATLAHNGDFSTYLSRVALSNKAHKSGIFPSPFDLRKQAYLYVPSAADMPEPVNDRGFPTPARTEYLDKLSDQVQQLITASQGDALVLFTAKSDLEYVKNYLIRQDYPYPVFAQGDYSPGDAMEAFRRTDKATLLGLKSFWEGIDVQGKKLFMVIVTKLPMPIEGDPVLGARLARYEETWMAFLKVKYPEMLSDLRQGVGRLIRSKTDKGVIAILDTRIHTKKYGKRLLSAIGLRPHSNLVGMCNAIQTRHEP